MGMVAAEVWGNSEDHSGEGQKDTNIQTSWCYFLKQLTNSDITLLPLGGTFGLVMGLPFLPQYSKLASFLTSLITIFSEGKDE